MLYNPGDVREAGSTSTALAEEGEVTAVLIVGESNVNGLLGQRKLAGYLSLPGRGCRER